MKERTSNARSTPPKNNPFKKRKRNKQKRNNSMTSKKQRNSLDSSFELNVSQLQSPEHSKGDLDLDTSNSAVQSTPIKFNTTTPKKPTLSAGLRGLKFMSRRKNRVEAVKDVQEIPKKVVITRIHKRQSNIPICRPLKRSILHLDSAAINKLGRKSFGSFNSSIERLQASATEVAKIEKRATSLEEMAEFMSKMKEKNNR